MEFKQKLLLVVTEIAATYGLTESQAKIIAKNVYERYKMYSEIKFKVRPEETRALKSIDSVGDFLLNRLIVNIRDYNIETEFQERLSTKGSYIAQYQQLNLASYESIKNVTRKILLPINPNLTEQELRKSTIKVFNHEIGHALQTALSGNYGEDDKRYRELLDSLSHRYPNEFYSYDELQNKYIETVQRGMKPRVPKKMDLPDSKRRAFYGAHAYTTHLDEIFNEDESLEVTGLTTAQIKFPLAKDIRKPIYNCESSNYKITSYGALMKALMGKERTFKAMYEDSLIAYDFFDQFIALSAQTFGDAEGKRPPMFHVLNSLENIKNKSSVDDLLRLDFFFTSILEAKVNNTLGKKECDFEDLDELIDAVRTFKKQVCVSPLHTLAHERKLLELQKKIRLKRDELKEKVKQSQIEQIIADMEKVSSFENGETTPGVKMN